MKIIILGLIIFSGAGYLGFCLSVSLSFSASKVNLEESYQLESSSSLVAKNFYAVIVDIYDYPGTADDLPQYKNGDAVNEVLANTCNFHPENIILLKNAEASESAIKDAFSSIRAQITSNDLFFFYFSGHGGSNAGYYALTPYDKASNWFWDYELNDELDTLYCAQKYVILSACHSGGFIPTIWGSGVYIMTSCQSDEFTYSFLGDENGIFTYFFKQSFNPSEVNDSNEDGIVTLDERFLYISTETASYMDFFGESQHPQHSNGISDVPVLNSCIRENANYRYRYFLEYDFTIFGHGLITSIIIYLHSTYFHTVEDTSIIRNATTLSGFERYTGVCYFEGGDEDFGTTGYQILVTIQGKTTITLQLREGSLHHDRPPIPSDNEVNGVSFGIFFLLCSILGILGVITHTYYNVRRREHA